MNDKSDKWQNYKHSATAPFIDECDTCMTRGVPKTTGLGCGKNNKIANRG